MAQGGNTDQESVTSQTLPILKSGDVDEDMMSVERMENPTNDVLSATAGPLRLSTEDIDFPADDTISVYEVKKGDTLSTVAGLYGVSKNTIIWANNLQSEKIAVGDTLLILPVTGIRHTVKKGDTVTTIAKKYNADIDDVTSYNGVAKNKALAVGDIIIVPEGELTIVQTSKSSSAKRSATLSSAPSGFFTRPVLGGRKTQGIHGNNGVDIGASQGTGVVAAASGRVILARSGGYNGGYGSMIVIEHERGIQTLYAHLRAVYVTQGQMVTQGQVIGEVGNTGRSTGPHLHFEVRGAKNPF